MYNPVGLQMHNVIVALETQPQMLD